MSTKLLMSLLPLALIPLLGGCATAGGNDRYYSDDGYYSNGASGYASEQAELDALLAPIALYPDTLLSHILIASTYPQEVLDAHHFVRNNPTLTGDAAVRAAASRGWDTSVTALTAFPDVLARMAEDMLWTEALGDAFLDNESLVMNSVQGLRNRAYDSGNLADAEQVRVVRENSIVVIEPRHASTIYAPYYDTRVVYGDWWWPDYPPTYWHNPSRLGIGSHFYWGSGVSLSSGFYFSSVNWNRRHLMVLDRPYWQRHYSAPAIIAHPHARPWRHNPSHRRNVGYRQGPAFDRFGAHQSRPALPPRGAHRDIAPQRFGPQRDAIHRRDARDRALPARPSRMDSRPDGRPNGAVRVNENAGRIEQRLRDNARAPNGRPEGYRSTRDGYPRSDRADRFDARDTRPNRPDNRIDNRIIDNRVDNRNNPAINRRPGGETPSRQFNTRPAPAPSSEPRSERARQYLQQQENKRQWRESQTPADARPAPINREGQMRERAIRDATAQPRPDRTSINRPARDNQTRDNYSRGNQARSDVIHRQGPNPASDQRQVREHRPAQMGPQNRPETNFTRPQFRDNRPDGNNRPPRGNDR